MCLVGVVVRRYIDFLILLIPTPLVSALFCSSIPTFCSFFKCFLFFFQYIFVIASEASFPVWSMALIFYTCIYNLYVFQAAQCDIPQCKYKRATRKRNRLNDLAYKSTALFFEHINKHTGVYGRPTEAV